MNSETICHPNITSAGLPWRTEALLERERKAYDSMVNTLTRGNQAPLTLQQIERALDSKEPGQAYTAAFLAGRCTFVDDGRAGNLMRRLNELGATFDEADVGIEAAMALVLRGDLTRGKALLEARLHSSSVLGDQYKAAFYLAQTGDPSGYAALVTTLHTEIAHYRLMALRHALAFAPYQGRVVGALQVDVPALLYERLLDADDMVRSEVPFYLEEIGAPGLPARLREVEQTDRSPSVRIAARMVLDRLEAA